MTQLNELPSSPRLKPPIAHTVRDARGRIAASHHLTIKPALTAA
ncbi:hypothetical protein [Cupriavidus sp. 8B]